MSTVKFKGEEVSLAGDLKVGEDAPKLCLKAKDLSDICIGGGKTQIILSVPSLDTPVCASEAREFNKKITELGKEVVLVSMDLPFAQGRFCQSEGIEGLKVASDFVHKDFGKKYGVLMMNGPLEGILARAVFVIKDGKIAYKEIAAEVTEYLDIAKLEGFLKGGGCGCGCGH